LLLVPTWLEGTGARRPIKKTVEKILVAPLKKS
jgi:hypothetical protein